MKNIINIYEITSNFPSPTMYSQNKILNSTNLQSILIRCLRYHFPCGVPLLWWLQRGFSSIYTHQNKQASKEEEWMESHVKCFTYECDEIFVQ